jgi:hypothetical protein
MKTRIFHLIVFFVAAALILNACNLPVSGGAVSASPSPASDQAIFTAAAQTLVVQFTQNAATQSAGEVEPPPSSTPEPEVLAPTETPTLAVTDTPAFTSTPELPMISASVATNCRRGPSKLYEPPVGVLNVNQTVQVFGRNDAGTWWYIQNPGKTDQYCWVWGDTTTVTGNTAGLSIVTPPPLPPTPTFTSTPGANFSASYETVHACGGTPTAIFEIDNNGGLLDSLTLKIEDVTAGTTLYGPTNSNAPFMGGPSECPPGGDSLPAGKTLYVGGAIGAGGSGHTARATIKLCTDDDLDGACATKTVEFTIP